MPLHKLDSNDAFVVLDLDDAPVSVGPVRLSPRATQADARVYARARTYTYALLERRVGGAAAGIKVEPADREAVLAAFRDEVAPLVQEGRFLPEPGEGTAASDFEALRAGDPRNPVLWSQAGGVPFAEVAAARSAAAAAEAILGGSLDGRAVTVQGWNVARLVLARELARRGAKIVGVATREGTAFAEGGFTPETLESCHAENGDRFVHHLGVEPGEPAGILAVEAEVFVPAPGLRSLTEDDAAALAAKAVLPATWQPIPPKPLAALVRRGVVVVPDLLALAGPAVAEDVDPARAPDEVLAEIDTKVSERAAACAGHRHSPFLGACEAAEAFLRSWRDELPFGRPLP